MKRRNDAAITARWVKHATATAVVPGFRPTTPQQQCSYEEASTELLEYRYKTMGRDWTEESLVCYINIALTLMIRLGCTKDWACRLLAGSGRGYKPILQAVNAWLAERKVNFTPARKRGQGSPNYKLSDESKRPHQLDASHRLLIVAHLDAESEENGRLLSAGDIQEFLAERGVNMSHRRMCQQLRAWGGKYKEVVRRLVVNKKRHEQRVAKYILRYDQARAKQEAETHVIVYTDESYCHSNHSPARG